MSLGSPHPSSGDNASVGRLDARRLDPERTIETSPAEIRELAHGSTLGRYVVLGRLGEGGMGLVYRAYDPRLRREVAIKCVRSKKLDEEQQTRLLWEAQAMAQLSHPNVVSVFDVDVIGDQVVLAMELAGGTDLGRWLRTSDRGVPAVLEMFRGAGAGLAAAHARGLLHRDFKPANVLVTEDGRPKVTDFGLAKLERSGESSGSGDDAPTFGNDGEPLTRPGTILGTPAYMAPEQYFEPGRVDARADQFAFCVALWEALSGKLPYPCGDLDRVMLAKRTRVPSWTANVAVPASIVEALRRGLQPQVEARWPDMRSLLDALTWDPKRRRKRLVMATAFGLTIAGSGAAASLVRPELVACTGAEQQLEPTWNEDRRSEVGRAIRSTGLDYAADVWTRTDALLQAYAAQWLEMHTEACEATRVHDVQSEAVLDLRVGCLREAQLALDAALARLEVADADAIPRAHDLIEALPPISRCAEVDRLMARGPREVDPATSATIEEMRGHLAHAAAYDVVGRYSEALAALDRIEPSIRATGDGALRVEYELRRGAALRRLGRPTEARDVLRSTLRSAVSLDLTDSALSVALLLVVVSGYELEKPDEALAFADVAHGLVERDSDPKAAAQLQSALAKVHFRRGALTESYDAHRVALDLLRQAGASRLALAKAEGELAVTALFLGRYDEAEQFHRATLQTFITELGRGHPEVAKVRANLAEALRLNGKLVEAETQLRDALKIHLAAFGERHPGTANNRGALGAVLVERDLIVEAEQEYRAAVGSLTELFGPDAIQVADARHNLAIALASLSRLDEAERELVAAANIYRKGSHQDHPLLGHLLLSLAFIQEEQDRVMDAEVTTREAIERLTKTAGPMHPTTARARQQLGVLLGKTGRVAAAELEFEAALTILENAVGRDHGEVASLLHDRGRMLIAHDRHADAVAILQRALTIAEPGEAHERTARIRFQLARALWPSVRSIHRSDAGRARELAIAAREYYRSTPQRADLADEIAEVDAWLQPRGGGPG